MQPFPTDPPTSASRSRPTRRSCLRTAAGLLMLPSLGAGVSVSDQAKAQELPSGDKPSAPAGTEPAAGPEFCMFTKHLLGMNFDELAAHLAELDMPTIEAPIRPGGHVEPEQVEEKLPKLVAALAKTGRRISILTSGINSISPDQHAERVLRAAKAMGIPFFRMNWWRYDLKKPILPQLENYRAQGRDLVAMCREIGIRPLYQNHKGAEMAGSPIWDIAGLMREYEPRDWGFAFDIMHATVEGGTSWPLQYHLVRERIGAAYFKDFQWKSRGNAVSCPLGEGYAGAAAYAGLLKASAYRGPVVLHVEYLAATKITSKAEERSAFEAARRDYATLRGWWA